MATKAPAKKVAPKEEVISTESFNEQVSSGVSKSEFDDFKNTMMQMMSQMMSQQKQETVQHVAETVAQVKKDVKKEIDSLRPFPSKALNSDELPEVNFNKMIRVMSIVNAGMTLSSTSRSYRFNNFGDIQSMTYSELLDVISRHTIASTEGSFLILDADAIDGANMRRHYDKFITASVIENILDYDIDIIEEVFTSTTEQIKETMLTFVYNKINAGEYVDHNKLTLMSKLSGVDIVRNADILKNGISVINISMDEN